VTTRIELPHIYSDEDPFEAAKKLDVRAYVPVNPTGLHREDMFPKDEYRRLDMATAAAFEARISRHGLPSPLPGHTADPMPTTKFQPSQIPDTIAQMSKTPRDNLNACPSGGVTSLPADTRSGQQSIRRLGSGRTETHDGQNPPVNSAPPVLAPLPRLSTQHRQSQIGQPHSKPVESWPTTDKLSVRTFALGPDSSSLGAYPLAEYNETDILLATIDHLKTVLQQIVRLCKMRTKFWLAARARERKFIHAVETHIQRLTLTCNLSTGKGLMTESPKEHRLIHQASQALLSMCNSALDRCGAATSRFMTQTAEFLSPILGMEAAQAIVETASNMSVAQSDEVLGDKEDVEGLIISRLLRAVDKALQNECSDFVRAALIDVIRSGKRDSTKSILKHTPTSVTTITSRSHPSSSVLRSSVNQSAEVSSSSPAEKEDAESPTAVHRGSTVAESLKSRAEGRASLAEPEPAAARDGILDTASEPQAMVGGGSGEDSSQDSDEEMADDSVSFGSSEHELSDQESGSAKRKHQPVVPERHAEPTSAPTPDDSSISTNTSSLKIIRKLRHKLRTNRTATIRLQSILAETIHALPMSEKQYLQEIVQWLRSQETPVDRKTRLMDFTRQWLRGMEPQSMDAQPSLSRDNKPDNNDNVELASSGSRTPNSAAGGSPRKGRHGRSMSAMTALEMFSSGKANKSSTLPTTLEDPQMTGSVLTLAVAPSESNTQLPNAEDSTSTTTVCGPENSSMRSSIAPSLLPDETSPDSTSVLAHDLTHTLRRQAEDPSLESKDTSERTEPMLDKRLTDASVGSEQERLRHHVSSVEREAATARVLADEATSPQPGTQQSSRPIATLSVVVEPSATSPELKPAIHPATVLPAHRPSRTGLTKTSEVTQTVELLRRVSTIVQQHQQPPLPSKQSQVEIHDRFDTQSNGSAQSRNVETSSVGGSHASHATAGLHVNTKEVFEPEPAPISRHRRTASGFLFQESRADPKSPRKKSGFAASGPALLEDTSMAIPHETRDFPASPAHSSQLVSRVPSPAPAGPLSPEIAKHVPEALSRAVENILALEAKLTENEEHLNELQQSNARLQSEIQALKETISHLSSEKVRLERQLIAKSEQLKSTESDLELITQKLRASRVEALDKRAELTSKEEALTQAENTILSLQTQLAEAKAQSEARQDLIDQLTEKEKSLTSELATVKANLTAETKAVSAAKTAHAVTREELFNALTQIATLKSGMQLNSLTGAMSGDIDSRPPIDGFSASALEAERNRFRMELLESQKALSNARTELAQTKSECAHLRAELERMQREEHDRLFAAGKTAVLVGMTQSSVRDDMVLRLSVAEKQIDQLKTALEREREAALERQQLQDAERARFPGFLELKNGLLRAEPVLNAILTDAQRLVDTIRSHRENGTPLTSSSIIADSDSNFSKCTDELTQIIENCPSLESVLQTLRVSLDLIHTLGSEMSDITSVVERMQSVFQSMLAQPNEELVALQERLLKMQQSTQTFDVESEREFERSLQHLAQEASHAASICKAAAGDLQSGKPLTEGGGHLLHPLKARCAVYTLTNTLAQISSSIRVPVLAAAQVAASLRRFRMSMVEVRTELHTALQQRDQLEKDLRTKRAEVETSAAQLGKALRRAAHVSARTQYRRILKSMSTNVSHVDERTVAKAAQLAIRMTELARVASTGIRKFAMDWKNAAIELAAVGRELSAARARVVAARGKRLATVHTLGTALSALAKSQVIMSGNRGSPLFYSQILSSTLLQEVNACASELMWASETANANDEAMETTSAIASVLNAIALDLQSTSKTPFSAEFVQESSDGKHTQWNYAVRAQAKNRTSVDDAETAINCISEDDSDSELSDDDVNGSDDSIDESTDSDPADVESLSPQDTGGATQRCRRNTSPTQSQLPESFPTQSLFDDIEKLWMKTAIIHRKDQIRQEFAQRLLREAVFLMNAPRSSSDNTPTISVCDDATPKALRRQLGDDPATSDSSDDAAAHATSIIATPLPQYEELVTSVARLMLSLGVDTQLSQVRESVDSMSVEPLHALASSIDEVFNPVAGTSGQRTLAGPMPELFADLQRLSTQHAHSQLVASTPSEQSQGRSGPENLQALIVHQSNQFQPVGSDRHEWQNITARCITSAGLVSSPFLCYDPANFGQSSEARPIHSLYSRDALWPLGDPSLFPKDTGTAAICAQLQWIDPQMNLTHVSRVLNPLGAAWHKLMSAPLALRSVEREGPTPTLCQPVVAHPEAQRLLLSSHDLKKLVSRATQSSFAEHQLRSFPWLDAVRRQLILCWILSSQLSRTMLPKTSKSNGRRGSQVSSPEMLMHNLASLHDSGGSSLSPRSSDLSYCAARPLRLALAALSPLPSPVPINTFNSNALASPSAPERQSIDSPVVGLFATTFLTANAQHELALAEQLTVALSTSLSNQFASMSPGLPNLTRQQSVLTTSFSSMYPAHLNSARQSGLLSASAVLAAANAELDTYRLPPLPSLLTFSLGALNEFASTALDRALRALLVQNDLSLKLTLLSLRETINSKQDAKPPGGPAVSLIQQLVQRRIATLKRVLERHTPEVEKDPAASGDETPEGYTHSESDLKGLPTTIPELEGLFKLEDEILGRLPSSKPVATNSLEGILTPGIDDSESSSGREPTLHPQVLNLETPSSPCAAESIQAVSHHEPNESSRPPVGDVPKSGESLAGDCHSQLGDASLASSSPPSDTTPSVRLQSRRSEIEVAQERQLERLLSREALF